MNPSIDDRVSVFCREALHDVAADWERERRYPVEAMAAGLPTMGSNVPGLARVIGDEALLFTPGNEIELASKIELLFAHQDTYRQWSQYALDRSSCFDSRRMAAEYTAIYRDLKGGKKRAS